MRKIPEIRQHLWLILLLFAVLSAGEAAASYPPVRNFTRAEYAWGSQNWASDEDGLGIMYFGNKFGLLTYDGTRWRNYILPNFSTVRAVLVDDSRGRVYTAGTEEFGYFTFSASKRRMEYVSLSKDFPNAPASYGEI